MNEKLIRAAKLGGLAFKVAYTKVPFDNEFVKSELIKAYTEIQDFLIFEEYLILLQNY